MTRENSGCIPEPVTVKNCIEFPKSLDYISLSSLSLLSLGTSSAPRVKHLVLRLPLFPAFCIAAACALFAPGRAEASCGDYVHLGGHAPQHLEMAPVTRGLDSSAPEGPRQGRCTGPFCSNGAPKPLGLPDAPPVLPDPEAGLLSVSADPPIPGSSFARHENDGVASRIFSSAIYRPPRSK